jgi:hypothetical protein
MIQDEEDERTVESSIFRFFLFNFFHLFVGHLFRFFLGQLEF